MAAMQAAAMTDGMATARKIDERLQPRTSIQPPASEPRMEPMRPIPRDQLTPVAREPVG